MPFRQADVRDLVRDTIGRSMYKAVRLLIYRGIIGYLLNSGYITIEQVQEAAHAEADSLERVIKAMVVSESNERLRPRA